MPERFELPHGWEIYAVMVFLSFSEVPRGEGSGNVGVFGEGEQSAGHPPRKGLGSILEALEASPLHLPALEALPEPLSPDDLQLSCHFQPKSFSWLIYPLRPCASTVL